jgi:hypothetical protein
MESKNVLLILGLILLLFFIMRNVRIYTPTTSKTTTVIYKRPTVAVGPHYNPYKTQYYN